MLSANRMPHEFISGEQRMFSNITLCVSTSKLILIAMFSLWMKIYDRPDPVYLGDVSSTTTEKLVPAAAPPASSLIKFSRVFLATAATYVEETARNPVSQFIAPAGIARPSICPTPDAFFTADSIGLLQHFQDCATLDRYPILSRTSGCDYYGETQYRWKWPQCCPICIEFNRAAGNS